MLEKTQRRQGLDMKHKQCQTKGKVKTEGQHEQGLILEWRHLEQVREGRAGAELAEVNTERSKQLSM